MQKITTQKDYDIVKNQVGALIKEAAQKGMLESGMDNFYTSKISELSRKKADKEKDFLVLMRIQSLNSHQNYYLYSAQLI